ncbi:MAG TPA: cytochrome c [Thermoanaerobaculia bacterium]|nr:cytochrome c [Thermoanaerobaculia bacterium]
MARVRPGFLVVALFALLVVTTCKEKETAEQTPGGTAAPRYKAIPANWKETNVDVFPGMNGVTLAPNDPALPGRIVWNLWVGDSGLMWDWLAQHGFGTADLIKTVDSRRHDTRFRDIGIINQPGFVQATKPDQYGLFIDVPDPADPEGQFDQKVDYATYGRSTGVIGLRISDNPQFTGAAKQAWMDEIAKTGGYAKRYYEDPSYFNNPKLVRPYIVGMSCALCHVSFDPVRPPADVNKPKWENLNDYIGAQYFDVTEFFVPRIITGGMNGQAVNISEADKESFVWQLIHTSVPGALDTSFIATDYINNPGTMNGVFNVAQRLSRAANGVTKAPGKYDPMVEQMAGGSLDLKWLTLDNGQKIPRVLKQGDDSVGFEGALSRVYVNIGHAWPEWRKHFRPLVGGPLPANPKFASQSPVPVKALQMNSASWNWSEDRSQALATYFVNYAKPLLLKDAPGGARHLTTDQAVLNRGKVVFAENCAACHSSRQPGFDPFTAQGAISEPAKTWFRTEVMKPEFFTDNFLSDERRHPVTQIGTNSARAAATNATRNHIWDNFSSETYKNLPPIGKFEVDNPYAPNGKSTVSIPLPGEPNGPGYYRPPSLISLWSSAPYLHNNTVGYDPTAAWRKAGQADVSVDARMRAFQDGIEKMLWIQDRGKLIYKTTQKSFINIPLPYLPDILQDAVKRHPHLIDPKTQSLKVGPIPEGTPINLIANTNLDPGLAVGVRRAELFAAILDTLARIKKDNLNDAQVKELMSRELVPRFLAVNKCPDFYVDKGHEFGRNLPLSDKRALIELLKTF